MMVLELVIAGVLLLFGLRSFLYWFGNEFDSVSFRDQVVYTLYVTARVGLWLAFAGFFAGYALIDGFELVRWYIAVPLTLAAIQLLAGMVLSRTPSPPRPPSPNDGSAGRPSSP